MTPERWLRVKAVLAEALEENPRDRAGFIDDACKNDQELRDEVWSLIAQEQPTDSFLERPLLDSAVDLRQMVRSSLSGRSLTLDWDRPAANATELSVAPIHRRPLFFWCAVCLAAMFGVLYLYAAWMVYQYGNTTKEFGWSPARRGNAWEIVAVDPAGPAAGRLRPGDRIVAFNGDRRSQVVGSGPYRRSVSMRGSYTLDVSRGQEAHRYVLSALPVTRAGGAMVAVTYVVVSFSFCLMGLVMGLFKPGDRLPQIGCLAGSAVALRLLGTGLEAYRPLGTGPAFMLVDALWLVDPWHLALGYHFFFILSNVSSNRRLWSALNLVLYVICGVLFAVSATLRIASLLGQEALIAMVWRFPILVDLNSLLLHSAWWHLLLIVAFASIGATMVLGYRQSGDDSHRRRIRWVVFGCAVSLSPLIVYSLGNLLSRASGAADLPSPLWRGIGHAVNLMLMAVPITLGYAVLKHRVMDIRVVIRRSLQHLLASRALEAILLLPVLGILWPVFTRPDRPLIDLFPIGSLYINLPFLAALVLSLRYRQQLRTWLDRKFFREAYRQETILREMLGRLRKLDNLDEVSRLVGDELGAALHPSFVCVFNQVSPKGLFVLSHSSGQASDRIRRLAVPGIARALAQDLTIPHDVVLPSTMRPGEFETSLLVPIVGARGELIGLLLLGEKKSDEPYGAADRHLLRGIADQIAVVHENAWLREQVKTGDELRLNVLGHLSQEHVNLLHECSVCGRCFDADVRSCPEHGGELTHPLPVERTIGGRYRLDQNLGVGGMAAVYEATDLQLKRKVAAKILSQRLFGNVRALRRFEREAQAVAKLVHPNVVAVYDCGPISSVGAYLIMERVYGSTWRAELDRLGVLSPVMAAEWLEQLLDGLGAAHAAGVVHRDLKPENVLIVPRKGGSAWMKIVDFGLAQFDASEMPDQRLTEPGTIIGTVGYMSPEQLQGRPCDERSDLFAVAVMTVEALTGRLPFAGRTPREVLSDIERRRFQLLPADSESVIHLSEVLRRCLDHDPERRCQTVGEMRSILLPALQAIPLSRLEIEEPVH